MSRGNAGISSENGESRIGYYGNLTRLEAFAAEIPVFSPASGSFGLFFVSRFERDSKE
jgi:hypothetical protein